MKKILLISSSPIKNDGLTRIEQQIVSYNKDMHFDIAAIAEDQEMCADFEKMGCDIIQLPSKSNPFKYMKAIQKAFLSGAYDAAYIHGNSALMYFEAKPVYALHREVPIIAHCHNSSTEHPLFHKLLKHSFNKCLNVKIGVSEKAAEWAFDKENRIVIPNGIRLEKYRSDSQARNKIRTESGWNDNKIIGHIGRFTEQKNQIFLIDIFHKVLQTDASYRLLLIGKGESEGKYLDRIREYGLEDKVKIIPSTEDVPAYLNAMDVMVLPSLFEGFCIVALEAQANGLPLITSDTLPDEAFVTSDPARLSLDAGYETWVKTILEYSGHSHADHVDQLKGTAADYETMMSSIRSVLLEQL